jgi:ArsR family transcriptional regulator, arsenate/arsenite/antimonite-responsive transcriptional repressor
MSHHLKILVDAGIFTRDKRGVWAYYAIVPGVFEALASVLSASPEPARSTGSASPIADLE